MTKFDNQMEFAGRLFLSLIFILSGLNKVGAAETTMGYMKAMGVPGSLLWPTVLFEVGIGLAVVVGFKTRLAAIALAGFSLFTAFLFHNNLTDDIQFIMFAKNVAIAGGFLLLARHGAGGWSLDARLKSVRDLFGGAQN